MHLSESVCPADYDALAARRNVCGDPPSYPNQRVVEIPRDTPRGDTHRRRK